MLGLSDFRQTRVYQEAFEEGELRGKFKAVPPMLALGLSVEQIAQGLDLDVEQARQAAVSHLLASGMGVEQVAEDLGLDVELVRQTAVSHLLASGMSVEQVAQVLGLEVELVRQIEASNTQNDEPTGEV